MADQGVWGRDRLASFSSNEGGDNHTLALCVVVGF